MCYWSKPKIEASGLYLFFGNRNGGSYYPRLN